MSIPVNTLVRYTLLDGGKVQDTTETYIQCANCKERIIIKTRIDNSGQIDTLMERAEKFAFMETPEELARKGITMSNRRTFEEIDLPNGWEMFVSLKRGGEIVLCPKCQGTVKIETRKVASV